MKVTIKNLKKVLENYTNGLELASKMFKENGDEETAKKFMLESRVLMDVVNMISDEEYFGKVCKVYGLEE